MDNKTIVTLLNELNDALDSGFPKADEYSQALQSAIEIIETNMQKTDEFSIF